MNRCMRGCGWTVLSLALATGCDSETAHVSRAPSAGVFEIHLAGLLSRDHSARRLALDAFRKGWDHVRGAAAKLADSERAAERMACAYLFSRLGNAGDLPVLRRLLADRVGLVRAAARPGTARLRDRASLATLVRELEAARYDDVRSVLATIRSIDPAAAERVALAMSTDARWARRRAAAQALGHAATRRAAAAVASLLDDPAWPVRADAARAARTQHNVAAQPALRRMLRDPESQVRAAAREALACFEETAPR